MNHQLIILRLFILVLIVFGLLGIAHWYNDRTSIYSLVFGVFLLILAWFFFHFRKKK